MSDASYVVGSTEYLIFEIEVVAPELIFVASEWTASVALCPASEPFDATTATWNNAVLETIDGTHYAKLLVGPSAVTVDTGSYKAFVRLTKISGGVEVPIIRVAGRLTFGPG